MRSQIDIPQQKRRLILSPILCVFFGVVGYVTAPSLLVFAIGIGVGGLLAPLLAAVIDQSERGQVSASATVGGVGAVALTGVLQAVLPDKPVVVFALCFGLFALCLGLGISAWGRLRG